MSFVIDVLRCVAQFCSFVCSVFLEFVILQCISLCWLFRPFVMYLGISDVFIGFVISLVRSLVMYVVSSLVR